MGALELVAFVNVIARYFTNQSFVWTEELSVFLVIVLARVGSSAAVARDPHTRIAYFSDIGSMARRKTLARFAVAMVGRGPGMLPLVAIVVAMFLDGISGSGPACASAVGGVMITAMSRAGYPASFSASVAGAAAATDILIPPSVAFVNYSTLEPGASVPALFAAGMILGVLAGVALIVPAVWLSRKYKMRALESGMPRPAFWASLKDAILSWQRQC